MMYPDTDEPQAVQDDATPSDHDPLFTSNRSLSPAVQEIDKELAHYAQLTISLKIKRNSHQLISRLPVEILCKIFELTQESSILERTFRPRRSHPQELSWIVLTHVCHFWRNAALSEPSLWTTPPLHYKKWTSVFLERSRMADLTLSFCVDDQSFMDSGYVIATLAFHMQRTTTLAITDVNRALMDKMFEHFSQTMAPNLKTLIMHDPARNNGWFSIPKTALLGANLRRLCLDRVIIPWNSPLLFGLTDLKLTRIPPSGRPTPTEFLVILEQNPGLRTLHLDYALPMESSLGASPPANRRILLQSLETLYIGSEESVCEFVFNNILLSERMRQISLNVVYGPKPSRHVHKLLAALRKACTGPPLGSRSRSAHLGETIYLNRLLSIYQSFAFGCGGGTPLFHDDLSPSLQSDSDALDFQISAHSESFIYFTKLHEVLDFFEALHWDNLAQLDISRLRVREPGLDAALATTFGTLPGLRAVAVGPPSVSPLLAALLRHSDKDPALFPGSVPFPALQYISMNDVTLAGSVARPSRRAVEMDALLDCLMDRCERGAQVISVSIRRCRGFLRCHCELMEEIVLSVDWDGSDGTSHKKSCLDNDSDVDLDSDVD